MRSLASYAAALLAGLLIFLGLPLVGWGLGQARQFFDSPARLSFALVIVLLQVAGLVYNPQVGRNNRETPSGVDRHKIDLILIQVFSLAVVVAAPFSDGHALGILALGEAGRFFGLLLVVVGFLLMQVAEKYLDRQFSVEVTLQKDHRLIQHGPYTHIRHPRYLGILLFFTGISLVFRSALAIALVMALACVLAWRIYAEEALMQQEFGAAWDAYRRRSWRIIPFLY